MHNNSRIWNRGQKQQTFIMQRILRRGLFSWHFANGWRNVIHTVLHITCKSLHRSLTLYHNNNNQVKHSHAYWVILKMLCRYYQIIDYTSQWTIFSCIGMKEIIGRSGKSQSDCHTVRQCVCNPSMHLHYCFPIPRSQTPILHANSLQAN